MALIALLTAIAYVALGLRRLRSHPDTPALMMAVVAGPAQGVPALLARILLWPALLRMPMARTPRGAERL